MNNLQPDLRSAPSLPASEKSELKMIHMSALFAYLAGFPEQKCEFWSSCAWRRSASSRRDLSWNCSSQSGCELEDTFTVRADGCLCSNEPKVTIIPLKAIISGQLQSLFVLKNKITTTKKHDYIHLGKRETQSWFQAALRTSPFRHVWCFREIHVGRSMCVFVWRVLVMYVCKRPISIITHQRGG